MTVFIRVDASIQIGTGHVMRCLTLAEALRKNSAEVMFICREHEGNMISFIESNGFNVCPLPNISDANIEVRNDHSLWLNTSLTQDASDTVNAIEGRLTQLNKTKADLVIVDHYAIDELWEAQIQELTSKLLVIDDLADRKHQCDILIDQTYLRSSKDYAAVVGKDTIVLTGSEYTILRDEFLNTRDTSLKRRRYPLSKILVSMGGVDKDNMTLDILRQLETAVDQSTEVTVLLGNRNPWKSTIEQFLNNSTMNGHVLHSTNRVADLLANTDLVIGASGTSSWERCCLGVPTIMFVIASNQEFVAQQLQNSGAVICATLHSEENYDLKPILSSLSAEKITELSTRSSKVLDGNGTSRILEYLF
jgi:UDP-2,4-diacetamido-2,4,6-trideoxy-beta-L-altropyranose hydrolase